MNLNNLQKLFDQATLQTGQTEFVVVGSLSILGIVQEKKIPERMLVSIDVDCFTRQDPERIFELNEKLGEESQFAAIHGFYLDPISPKVPTLPEDWEHRLIRVPLKNNIIAFFLDPNDAAVSKYARGEPRDREWIQAGLDAGLLSDQIIESRFRQTAFLDTAEKQRALMALAEDKSKIIK